MPSNLTQLIHRAQQGDRRAADALYAETYADLRRLARSRLRACHRPTLLVTCALVHEYRGRMRIWTSKVCARI